MQIFANDSSVVHIRGLDQNADGSGKDTFIIGAGFGRTGTSSMQIALSKLGWRSFHMREFFKNGSQAYNAAIKVGDLKWDLREKCKDYDTSFGNYEKIVLSKDAFDWNELFDTPTGGKYNATVDFPLCAFVLDLMEFYKPNYKVVLTVRDNPKQWYDSVDRTIHQLEYLNHSFALRFLSWIDGVNMLKMRNVTYGPIFDQPRGQTRVDFWANEKRVCKKYEDWIEMCKRCVPKSKLLIFNVKQGWKPLTDFLGVDAPDEPFPRSNETANMLKDVEKCKDIIFKFNCAVTTLGVLFASGIVAAGYFGFKKLR